MIRLPDSLESFAAIVTGHLGEECGLFILRGSSAFADARRVIEDDAGPDSIDPGALASINVQPMGAIDRGFRGLLHEAASRDCGIGWRPR